MSFQYKGIELDQLKLLWPKIEFKIADKLKIPLDLMNEVQTNNVITTIPSIIRLCCDVKPERFDEYTSLAMISTILELVDFPSTSIRLQKQQLMTHTFNANVEQWCHDHEKVLIFIPCRLESHDSVYCIVCRF